ncbi:Fpg/Nei family DNA glycosylase [Paenibacillus ginsengarvi]|uniref:Formamidopyrimidine-DNA glycosylase n=1 Tax=Paenibacillus ginsengarvi TaxID=400777 RepID=A0A3B0CGM0_9BACL|nr:DNA-formamidopyrimidine glycosylase family protein [Paenibacillus ginsengarvi]RKN84141.1 Fpg/Nei family DNA glycosylase [Paenibacillus ginsengarvi]
MPELPEMETYRTLLSQRILHTPIAAVQVEREKSINVPVPTFRDRVEGRTITGISRRAKHLLFHLDSGSVLLLHLMLGGWMFYGTEREKPDRTTQVVLSFGERSLYFIGLRLGYLHLHTTEETAERLSELGPEPIAPDFDAKVLGRLLTSKRTTLKQALTDQRTMAGIGNCYADELAFDAGILPTRRTNTLSAADHEKLFHSMRSVLAEAIRFGGYMENPLFPGDALTGGFDSRCKVYDRGGEPCLRCGSPLVQEELASRKVFYCLQCQE